MKLFYAPGACSQAVHIALREAGLPFQSEKVDLRAKKTEGGADFKAINPKGYVPALQLDDGQVLTEVQVLLQYVADKAPDKKLVPAAGTLERYRAQEWLAFIATELHKQFGPFFYPTTTDEAKAAQAEKISGRFDYVNERIVGPFLTGETFTIADAYLFVMTGWAGHIAKIDIGRWPKLAALAKRVSERPAVGQVLEAEGFKK
jgi:glutathione S-transferase